MVDGYDKPLHAPLRYKTMETPARELDEARLEAAIAGVLAEADAESEEPCEEFSAKHPELPELQPEETETETQNSGVAALLRQKWAEFSGAA
ncbi:hypothetical protein [Ruegeria arenilitoris]|uniref:hypothetical protein n=1 Tax=Ruegeria arenilitoris TaxID=1173585 RepID=UPI00147F210A|nr:hypothetical protein [Ruegeria arenilitoris]